uniref:WGS project CAEQ00000000 data, annotated contig 217 n=1 Tax=Trypanosoma congolense (strain IL3000) TaxID=1068625 RepID=F9WC19_TRYCI|nr:unnamed protein product [Trypanosoma congolense IL3000]
MTFATKLPATAAVVALLAVAAPRAALAFPTLHCDKVWEGPSAENDILDCLTSGETLKEQWQIIAFVAVCVLLLVAFVVGFPVALCCACCCRSRFRASEKDGGKSQRCCLWMWVGYFILWSFLALLLLFLGSKQFASSTGTVIHKTVNNPLDFLECTAERLVDLLSDWSSGERKAYEDDVDISFLDDVMVKLDSLVKNGRDKYDTYFAWLPIVSYVFVGIFVATAAITVFFGFFRISSSPLLNCFSCVYLLFGVVLCVMSTLLFVVSHVTERSCGEMYLHLERKPGVIQWYGVPLCREAVDLEGFGSRLRDGELDVCRSVCEHLLENCDNIDEEQVMRYFSEGNIFQPQKWHRLHGNMSAVPYLERRSALNESKRVEGSDGNYSTREVNKVEGPFPQGKPPGGGAALPVKVLKCGNNITSTDQCTDLGVTATVLEATRVKSFVGSCPVVGQSCSVRECAANCSEGEAKDTSIKVVQGAGRAHNTSIALSYGRPLLECNFLLDTLLTAVLPCDDLKPGALLLSVGFFLGALFFGLGIYVLLRGSCIWSKSASR